MQVDFGWDFERTGMRRVVSLFDATLTLYSIAVWTLDGRSVRYLPLRWKWMNGT